MLTLLGHIDPHWGKPGQELKARASSRRHREMLLADWLSRLLSYLSYTVQANPPRGGATHSELGLPISIIIQENLISPVLDKSQTWPTG